MILSTYCQMVAEQSHSVAVVVRFYSTEYPVGTIMCRILSKTEASVQVFTQFSSGPGLLTAYLFQMEELASLWPLFSRFSRFSETFFVTLAKACLHFRKSWMPLWLPLILRHGLCVQAVWSSQMTVSFVDWWFDFSFSTVLTLWGWIQHIWTQKIFTNVENLPAKTKLQQTFNSWVMFSVASCLLIPDLMRRFHSKDRE